MPGLTMQSSEDVELEKILRKASMPDNTVIITTLNRAWATPNSMIDLFLESFRIGERISRFLAYDSMPVHSCSLRYAQN